MMEISAAKSRIRCFKPIYSLKSKILVLGTIPGDESLRKGIYYANSKNMFWDFMYRILLPDYPPYEPFDINIPKQERYDLLLENGIALWDIISDCIRGDSRDSKIVDPKFNDIGGFVEMAGISYILCNGGKANDFLLKSNQLNKLSIPTQILGSSSTSNQTNVFKTFNQWRHQFSKLL